MPAKLYLEDYESRATKVGECLITHCKNGWGTSRRVYQLRHGKLPRDIFVCHKCDNPRCIRDDHHFPGTASENLLDAVSKGRLKPTRGYLGHKHSEEMKMGMRKSLLGNKNSLGHKHSEETKKKMSAAQKERQKREAKARAMPTQLTGDM
jgi:hypothetical protein